MWDSTYEAPIVTVCGERCEEEAGAPFAETVKEYARNAGFSKFRVFLTENGVETEVDAENAPDTFREGMEVTVKPYEKAA